MAHAFNLQRRSDGIALLYFDVPGQSVNIFNAAVFDEFESVLQTLDKNPPKILLILSAKKDIFIAGADINEFLKIKTLQKGFMASRRGQLAFQRLHLLPFPTIAVIDGACMGGGTEMSLACTFRLASDSPKTKIALPEVKLGILPGWGGTQRLPKCVGLKNALDIILSGKNIAPQQALRLGLIDGIISENQVEIQAIAFAKGILAKSQKTVKRRGKSFTNRILEDTYLGRLFIFYLIRKRVLVRTFANYPAPLKAIDVVRQTYRMNPEKGLPIEARALAELILTDESHALVNLFLWQDELKKNTAKQVREHKIKSVQNVQLITGSASSFEWACSLARKGIRVSVLGSVNTEQDFTEYLKQHSADHEINERIRNTVTFKITIDSNGGRDVILIDEANADIATLQRIEKNFDGAVGVIVNGMTDKKQLAGILRAQNRFPLYFYYPVGRNRIVEVGTSPAKNEGGLYVIFSLLQELGKIPIRIRRKNEFLFEYLLLPYLSEALRLLSEGIEPTGVDNVLKRFGMESAPFALMDAMGLRNVLSHLQKSENIPEKISVLLQEMIRLGWMGKESGKGFYDYSKKKKRANKGLGKLLTNNVKTSDLENVVKHRVIFLMINRAVLALEKELVSLPKEIDVASVFGLGFAPFRGGIYSYAQALGWQTVWRHLSDLQRKFGARFSPVELIVQKAKI